MCDESDGVIGIAIMNRVITCPADSIHAAMIRVLLPLTGIGGDIFAIAFLNYLFCAVRCVAFQRPQK